MAVGFIGEDTIDLMGSAKFKYFSERIETTLTRASQKVSVYCGFGAYGAEKVANRIAKPLFPERYILSGANIEHPLATTTLRIPDYKDRINFFIDFCDYFIVLRSHGNFQYVKLDSVMTSNKPILLLEYYRDDKWLNLG